MSVDKLLERIRKTKNPSVIDLSVMREQIPDSILNESETTIAAMESYGRQVMQLLKGIVPAIRLSYGYFACMGAPGLDLFHCFLQAAKDDGFYVIVDTADVYSERLTRAAAEFFMNLPCDGLVVSGHAGSDIVKIYADFLKQSKKSVFVTLRSPNRSASQLQDLMAGSRLVHIAAADHMKRLCEEYTTRSGYSQIGAVAAANSAESLRLLRSKYPGLFLLVDGYDYTNANAKNCSFAFDKLGHGAIVCACDSILSAWKDEPMVDPLTCVQGAAERMKKNITRYISIL